MGRKERELRERKERLMQVEGMIEDVFYLEGKDSLDIRYLGRLLDTHKKLGGDTTKYHERYLELLN